MKHLPLLLALLFLAPHALRAGEKANTVLIHPGEVIYARFTQSGIKLKLVKASKEPDDQAQVILTLSPADPAKPYAPFQLKVENKFALDLDYEGQVRSFTMKRHMPAEVYPVVAGKLSFVSLPPKVDETALFGWKLEK